MSSRYATKLQCILAVSTAILIGILYRFAPLSNQPLWVDELWRANHLLDPNLLSNYFYHPNTTTAITSPVYAIYCKIFAALYISPLSLRLSSMFAGIASIYLSFKIVQKSTKSIIWGALCATFFSLNVNFIEFSAQLKPYTFEILIQLILLFLWISILKIKSIAKKDVSIFFIAAAIALISSPNCIAVFPGMIIGLILKEYDECDSKLIKFTFLLCVLLSIYSLACYQGIWSYGARDNGLINFWGDGFYSGSSLIGYIKFASYQLNLVVLQSFNFLGGKYTNLATTILFLFTLVILITDALIRKNKLSKYFLVFFVINLISILFLNALRLWPIGPFRTNLFIYCHILVITTYSLSRVKIPIVNNALKIAIGIYLTYLVLTTNWASAKYLSPPLEDTNYVFQDFAVNGDIGSKLLRNCVAGIKTNLIITSSMSHAMQYYRHYDSFSRNAYKAIPENCTNTSFPPEAYSDPTQFNQILKNQLKNNLETWVLISHFNENDLAETLKVSSLHGTISHFKSFKSAAYFQIQPK